jgi:twitching motility protein PilU
VLSEVIMEKRGLVLVVGSTGSGKSTTWRRCSTTATTNRSGHILTVEDPIEYLFKHKKSIVNQREIGLDTLDWENALKNAMRQAPDCILIGEIRDRKPWRRPWPTPRPAICAWPRCTPTTLSRPQPDHQLLPAGKPPAAVPSTFPSTLKCIISQRLVKKPDGKRIPAVEILLNTRHIQELIETGEINGIKEAMEQSLAPGLADLRAGSVPPLQGQGHHPRRGAGQLRLADQPVLADQQRPVRHARHRKIQPSTVLRLISTRTQPDGAPSRIHPQRRRRLTDT